MKRSTFLTILLLAGLCLLVNRNAMALELDAEGMKAYKMLQTVPFFAIGGVGFAGRISQGEQAFRVLLQQKHGTEAFQALVKKGQMEGRLYGLLGLKLQDNKAFQKALSPFLTSKATAKTMQGCIMSDRAVSDVAKEIEKGNYH